MRKIARVIFDEAHRPAWSTRPETAALINAANPADSSYEIASETLKTTGYEVDVNLDAGQQLATKPDVLVLLHGSEDEWESTTKVGSPKYSASEIDSMVAFVENGGGLIIFGETEQLKYGNSANDIANRFGLNLQNVTVQDAVNNLRDVASWVLADLPKQAEHDLLCGVTAFVKRAGKAPYWQEAAQLGG